jgi:hypothetical protein
MKAGKDTFAHSASDPIPVMNVARDGIPTAEDRFAGAIECSLEVTGWMILAGVVVAIFTLRFALIFFIAMLLMIFRWR